MTARRRLVLGLVLTFILGCSRTSKIVDIPAELSEGHDYIAAVALDATGNPIAFSGIDGIDRHVDIAVEDLDAVTAVDVLAWTRRQLPGMDLADPAEARTTPLVVAERCEASLAAPSRVARGFGDGSPPTVPYRLSSAAVPSGACLPGWSRQLAVGPRCVTSYCQPLVTEQGCRATVDLGVCGLDTFVVEALDGSPCVTRVGDPCASARTVAADGTELSCPARVDCDIRFYTTRPTDWATVQIAPVLDVQPTNPSDLLAPPIRSFLRLSGYLGAVTELDGRVGVVSRRGRFQNRDGCGDTGDAEVVWFDADLTVASTSTVPGCIGPIQALPGGRRAITAWVEPGSPPQLWVGELTRAAGITRRRLVVTSSITLVGVTEAVISPTDRRVLIGVSTGDGPSNDTIGQLAIIDPDTLETELFAIPDSRPLGLAVVGREVVVAGGTDDRVTWLDVERRTVAGTVNIPDSSSLGDLEVDDESLSVWLAIPNEDHAVFVFRGRELQARATVFEDDWYPITLMRAGLGAGRIIVGSVLAIRADGGWNAGISRGEPTEDGVLPGVITLGFGIVGNHVRAADGALWATLPWSGEVVRITLAEDTR